MIANRQSALKYTFGRICEGWLLHKSVGLNVRLEHSPPGGTTSAHYHNGMRQFFYALRGCVSVTTNEGTYRLHAGDGVLVDGGVPHRVHNEEASPAEYLVVEDYSDDCGSYYDCLLEEN